MDNNATETNKDVKNLAEDIKAQLQKKDDALANLRKQSTDFLIDVPDKFEKPVSFVMTGDGIKYVRKTGMGVFVLNALKVPGLKTIDVGLHLSIPKIPFELICQCLSFFKDVHERDKTEASALIFWDPDKKEHFVYVPEQTNSGGLSEFHMDKEVDRLRVEKVPVMELHSHHTMGAFWSGTDNANENAAQCYMVFGTITTTPTYLVRYACAGVQENICIWNIVKEPDLYLNINGTRFSLPIPNVMEKFPTYEYPKDEWMGKLKKTVPAWQGQGYGAGNFQTYPPKNGTSTTGVGIKNWNRVPENGVVHRPKLEKVWHEHPKPRAEQESTQPQSSSASHTSEAKATPASMSGFVEIKPGVYKPIGQGAAQQAATGGQIMTLDQFKSEKKNNVRFALITEDGQIFDVDGNPLSVSGIKGHPLNSEAIIERVTDEFVEEEIILLLWSLQKAGFGEFMRNALLQFEDEQITADLECIGHSYYYGESPCDVTIRCSKAESGSCDCSALCMKCDEDCCDCERPICTVAPGARPSVKASPPSGESKLAQCNACSVAKHCMTCKSDMVCCECPKLISCSKAWSQLTVTRDFIATTEQENKDSDHRAIHHCVGLKCDVEEFCEKCTKTDIGCCECDFFSRCFPS